MYNPMRTCDAIGCEKQFKPKNIRGVFCSNKCRQKTYRDNLREAKKKGYKRVKKERSVKVDIDYRKKIKEITKTELGVIEPVVVTEVVVEKKENKLNSFLIKNILGQIEMIRLEKPPPERNTPLGKKSFEVDKNNLIKELEEQIKILENG